METERHVSLNWFICGPSKLVELDFGHVVFCGGRKPENPEKNPLRDRERREPGQGWIGTQATIVGGEGISPLRHLVFKHGWPN